jgi:hypothetical protein
MWETSQLINTTPPVITKSNMSLWTMGNMAILCEWRCRGRSACRLLVGCCLHRGCLSDISSVAQCKHDASTMQARCKHDASIMQAR